MLSKYVEDEIDVGNADCPEKPQFAEIEGGELTEKGRDSNASCNEWYDAC